MSQQIDLAAIPIHGESYDIASVAFEDRKRWVKSWPVLSTMFHQSGQFNSVLFFIPMKLTLVALNNSYKRHIRVFLSGQQYLLCTFKILIYPLD